MAGRAIQFAIESLEPRRMLAIVQPVLSDAGVDPYYTNEPRWHAKIHNRLLFIFNGQLWSVDTTAASPVAVNLTPSGRHANIAEVAELDQQVIFATTTAGTYDYETFTELFVTNGTKAGTSALPLPKPNFEFGMMQSAAGTLFFNGQANDQGYAFMRDKNTGQYFEFPDFNFIGAVEIGGQAYVEQWQEGILYRVDPPANGSAVLTPLMDLSVGEVRQAWTFGNQYLLRSYYSYYGAWITTDLTDPGTHVLDGHLDYAVEPAFYHGDAWLLGGINDDYNPPIGLFRIDHVTGLAELEAQFSGEDQPDPDRVFSSVASDGGRLVINIEGKIWASDGTQSGTHLLNSLSSVSATRLVQSGGRVFVVGEDSDHGSEVWLTDGTDAGTKVLDINRGSDGSGPSDLYVDGDWLYLHATVDEQPGTYRANFIAPNQAPSALFKAPDPLVEGKSLTLDASASTDPEGDRLNYNWDLNGDGKYQDYVTDQVICTVSWKALKKLGITDGPATFNIRVKVSDRELATVSGAAALQITDAAPVIGVTTPKAVAVNTIAPLIFKFTDPGADTVSQVSIKWGDGASAIYPTSQEVIGHVYKSTGKFTIKVTATNEDGSFPASAATMNVVARLTGVTKISGTINGMYQEPLLISLKDKFFFVTKDSNDQPGLYVSDGTDYGTQLLLTNKDVIEFFNVDKLVYFSVRVPGQIDDSYNLWRTDGTRAGTFMIQESGPQLTFFDGYAHKLYFTTADKMYCTDGTVGGTHEVAIDFVPSNGYTNQAYYNGAYYWVDASPDVLPQERDLYRLDANGVTKICTLFHGDPEVDVTLYTAGQWIFIERKIYTSTIPEEGAVWRSDGTAQGTIVVKAASKNDVRYSTVYAGINTLLFVAPVDKSHKKNKELWAVGDDGKVRLIKEIRPGIKGSGIVFQANAGAYTFFTANDGTHGNELWRTDGTAAGTALVKDLGAGSSIDMWYAFTSVKNLLFFNGDNKLYCTDGTAAGTILLASDKKVYYDQVMPYKGKILYTMRTTSNVPPTWGITDGTLKGTHTITDLTAAPASGDGTGYVRILAGNLFYESENYTSNWSEWTLWRIFSRV